MGKITLQNDFNHLSGVITVPGDKSISHRAVMFGAIAKGETTIQGFLPGEDCLSTISCFKKMGVKIHQEGDRVLIESDGLEKLKEPDQILDVGNSGTTTRLMLGILATRPFLSVIIGDESIGKRPMDRVTKPLIQMNAKIDGRDSGKYTPLTIRGGNLTSIDYVSPVASAQVKSCILLAGLGAKGTTSVTEPEISRDHTERMLEAFGVKITREGKKVSIIGGQELHGTDIVVPGDISSAAFFLVAGAIVPNSEIRLENVGMNPTRTGIIEVLQDMGAELIIENEAIVNGEPVADLIIKTSNLKGTTIGGEIIPKLIDEIPVIALLATQAEGTTIIKDAQELKVKETNRIDTVVDQLKILGANVEATDDGMIIHGKSELTGGMVDSYHDHRIGMTFAIASLISKGAIELENYESVSISYPNFFSHLERLKK